MLNNIFIFFKALIITILFIGFLLLTAINIRADSFVLKEISIDIKQYSIINGKARNLLIYPDNPKEGLNLNIETDILKFMYSSTTIESLTSQSQFRGVGMISRFGFHLTDSIDLGFYHHSQHVLDREIQTLPKFPTEDAIQLKFFLYKPKEVKETK